MEWAHQENGRAHMNINDEFVHYLKEGNFASFMKAWRTQMERLGRLGGSVTIPLNDQNREDINGLLGIDYHEQTQVKLSWTAFHKAIQNSRFEHADFINVLSLYYKTEIISNRELKENKEQQVERFLQSLNHAFLNTKASLWLQFMKGENGSVYSKIKQAIIQDSKSVNKQLNWAMEGMNALPLWRNESENLAIFSSQITGDPHAFDGGEFIQYVFVHAICYFLKLPYEKMNNIQKNELLFQVGLYKDSVSNFCMIAHINAFVTENVHHLAWNGFYEYYEAWNIHVDNVQNISAIDETSCSIVFVVENPSVFQSLVAYAKNENLSNTGFLCTNGQLNYCGYLLMDKINQRNITMMYSGDMDPEGLLIADKLKTRYKEKLKLWHYSRSDFEKAKSNKYANKKRLAMLDLILSDRLRCIGEYLKDEAIGYQENLLEEYKADILLYD